MGGLCLIAVPAPLSWIGYEHAYGAKVSRHKGPRFVYSVSPPRGAAAATTHPLTTDPNHSYTHSTAAHFVRHRSHTHIRPPYSAVEMSSSRSSATSSPSSTGSALPPGLYPYPSFTLAVVPNPTMSGKKTAPPQIAALPSFAHSLSAFPNMTAVANDMVHYGTLGRNKELSEAKVRSYFLVPSCPSMSSSRHNPLPVEHGAPAPSDAPTHARLAHFSTRTSPLSTRPASVRTNAPSIRSVEHAALASCRSPWFRRRRWGACDPAAQEGCRAAVGESFAGYSCRDVTYMTVQSR